MIVSYNSSSTLFTQQNNPNSTASSNISTTMLFFFRILLIIYVLIPCYFCIWTVLRLLSAPPSWEPERGDWEEIARYYTVLGPMVLSCVIALVRGLDPVLIIVDLLILWGFVVMRLGLRLGRGRMMEWGWRCWRWRGAVGWRG